MPLTLTWTGATTLPVLADGLGPDRLSGLSSDGVARLELPVGNARAPLGDLFRVEGDPSDGQLHVEGDLRPVRNLGAGMTSGWMRVRGDVGPHLGAGMAGGTIELEGSAGAWAGAEMRGGLIRIRGTAGDHLGGAYPGSRRGMREGIILVEGTVGQDAGQAMRRGLIAVAGSAGDGVGRGMIAGSIFVFGPVGRFPGAGMKRGTIGLFVEPPPALLPTFRPSIRYRPPFLMLYLRSLRSRGFPVPDRALSGPVLKSNGDLSEKGQGEILVWA